MVQKKTIQKAPKESKAVGKRAKPRASKQWLKNIERETQEVEQLKVQYEKATGMPMPMELSTMAVDKVREVVKLAKQNIIAVVPKAVVRSTVPKEDTLRDWDRDSE